VVVEERPQLVGPHGERPEHVGHEPGLLRDHPDPLAKVVGQVGRFDDAEPADRGLGAVHGAAVLAAHRVAGSYTGSIVASPSSA
jgi:hypothetical protein